MGLIRQLMLLVCVLLGGCVESTTYTPLPPSVPRLRLPQNDAYQGSVHTGALRPRFVWSASTTSTSGTLSYELQYSADATFRENVTLVSTEETSYQPEAALPVSLLPPVGQRYYWRVRACLRDSCSEYSPGWWINLGRSNIDYNGDGDPDLAVGGGGTGSGGSGQGRAYVFFGGPGMVFDGAIDATLSSPTGSIFGFSVASAGDVNADGFSDLLVGDYGDRNSFGAAYLYLGGPGVFNSVADAKFTYDSEGLFGYSVSGVGDLNRDGFSDFAIGAPDGSFQGSNSGTVTIYFGSKSPVFDRFRIVTSTLYDQVGRTVAPAGDMNGDGFADLAVAALGHNNFGSVYVYLGGADLDLMSDMKLPGNLSVDFEGATLRAADFNTDGFSDLVVGVHARRSTTKPGRADIYMGGEVLDRNADLAFEGASVIDKLGQSIAVGDIDGDGHADLLLGSVSDSGDGKVRLHLGGEGGLIQPAPALSMVGQTTADHYGEATAIADFNSDGVDDVAVGAPRDSGGKVFLYFGTAGAPLDTTPNGIVDSIGGGIGSPIASP